MNSKFLLFSCRVICACITLGACCSGSVALAADGPDIKALIKQADAALAARQESLKLQLTEERKNALLGTQEEKPTTAEERNAADAFIEKFLNPLRQVVQAGCRAQEELLPSVMGYAGKLEVAGISYPQFNEFLKTVDPFDKQCEDEVIAQCRQQKNPAHLVDFWNRSDKFSPKTVEEPDAPQHLPDTKMYVWKLKYIIETTAQRQQRAERYCDPKAYSISGTAGPMTVSGRTCSTSDPFTVKGEGGMMVVIFSFKPSSDTGGTMTYEGSGGGVTMSGSGSYTISADPKTGGTLTNTSAGRVNTSYGGSASYTNNWTLKPIDPC